MTIKNKKMRMNFSDKLMLPKLSNVRKMRESKEKKKKKKLLRKKLDKKLLN